MGRQVDANLAGQVPVLARGGVPWDHDSQGRDRSFTMEVREGQRGGGNPGGKNSAESGRADGTDETGGLDPRIGGWSNGSDFTSGDGNDGINPRHEGQLAQQSADARVVVSCVSDEKEGTAVSDSSNGSRERGSSFGEQWARQSMLVVPMKGRRRSSFTSPVAIPDSYPAESSLEGKDVEGWTAADVRTWLRSLPLKLAAFAEAEAFVNGSVDGARLATLTMKDMKRTEFHHRGFQAKVGAL